MSREEQNNSSPFPTKVEKQYLNFCKQYPDQVIMSHKSSVQEGFEYLFGAGFEGPMGAGKPTFTKIAKRFRSRGGITMMKIMVKYGPKMIKGIKRCFQDLDPYLTELETSAFKIKQQKKLDPDIGLWNELQEYASNKWDIIKIGFTELPNQLIFKDKCVLFEHALVFMQEMKKDKIDTAPLIPANMEVMRVYATLGEAVNDIARWLRKKGVRCQSNHPLGGLVCTPPLAGKAGMGGIGRHGMLITPEFGSRQRLAPIFIEKKLFDYTDNNEHDWIEQYCLNCRLCQIECPTEAIQEEKRINIDGIPGIGSMRTCIDREKCFPYFSKTRGCGICIKVCPFSVGKKSYMKLKKYILKERN